MCFSASASLSAGVVLTVIGIASIKKTNHKSQLWFASIPLVFGVQQLAEGVLWLTLPNPDLVNTQIAATYIFLFFAQIIWSLWVPIAIIMLDERKRKSLMQRILVGAGILISGYLAYCLLTFSVEANIVGHHIVYFLDYPPSLKIFVIILYASATIAPLFFSHIKRMWILGVAIMVSYIVATIFYEHYVLSVWCFFSSIISVYVYLIVRRISRKEKEKLSL